MTFALSQTVVYDAIKPHNAACETGKIDSLSEVYRLERVWLPEATLIGKPPWGGRRPLRKEMNLECCEDPAFNTPWKIIPNHH